MSHESGATWESRWSGEPRGTTVVRLTGTLNTGTAAEVLARMLREIASRSPTALTVDLSGVSDFDDFGALVLFEIRRTMDAAGGDFDLAPPPPKVREILDLVRFHQADTHAAGTRPKRTGFILRLGETTLTVFGSLRFMVSFLGSTILSFLHVVRHPRSLRLGDTIAHMEKIGVNAVPIVGLISFLLGLVIAFMSSIQLRQFGANAYVASLVAIAMVSELGPIMTAIMVAGRSGSAFAAEIGTMKISEEIDALVVMGFDPTRFLAVPRIIASILVVPLLTLFADFFAIAGGLMVGVLLLDLTPVTYMSKTLEVLTLFEVCWGLSKSLVFAVIVVMVGCFRGFQTRGGADAVGNAATSAVVTSIFFIILLDSFFAVARSYW